MTGRPAIFLDRDGVLNRVVERDGKIASPRSVAELMIEPQASEALTRARRAGYALFAVTNQPDVTRGLMSAAALDAIHAALAAALPLDGIAACLHDNVDQCACRKPRPGMLLDLASRHGLDLDRSWMVGDQARDMECGRAAGCTTLLLDRPYNQGAEADHVAATLGQAVETIIRTPLRDAERMRGA